MPELLRLHADHAPAVLAFELANRAYFAASISDRGDDFFDRFSDRFHALLAEQEAGICAFHVLVTGEGSVLGRFNLVDIEDGSAELGYRVAQHVTGRGVATAAVRELCGTAAARYGLHTLRAGTAHQNFASRKVLVKAGFVPVGPADPAHLGGKPGTWYERDLTLGPYDATSAADRGPGLLRPPSKPGDGTAAADEPGPGKGTAAADEPGPGDETGAAGETGAADDAGAGRPDLRGRPGLPRTRPR